MATAGRSARVTEFSPPGLGEVLEVCRRLKFEPHDIAGFLDARGRYEVPLDREFPLLVKLFRYTSRRHTRGATWHERLELFMPLDGPARFRMGDREVGLERGDLLVVDHLKLHHVVDFPGFDTRVIVVSFRPEFVYSLGSPSHDYAFLLPFYSARDRIARVLRPTDAVFREAGRALARLLQCYFGVEDRRFFEAGCKAHLLELLYHLARHFGGSPMLHWEFLRQQQRSLRLKPLFDHIAARYEERLPLAEAAALVGLSPAQFTKTFKHAAGTTLVNYVNHVRLSRAARLLRETAKSIAEIASEVGFADQSYFDRRFKAAFGQTPRAFRSGKGTRSPGSGAAPHRHRVGKNS